MVITEYKKRKGGLIENFIIESLKNRMNELLNLGNNKTQKSKK